MKILVGILKESSDQLQSYIDKGFHVEDINDHVKEFGSALMKMKLSDDQVSQVREKGYKVSSLYWVHLALMSAKENDKIVVCNLQEEDNKKMFSRIV
jgi:hypothetical protein